jgi:hypothetical protein
VRAADEITKLGCEHRGREERHRRQCAAKLLRDDGGFKQRSAESSRRLRRADPGQPELLARAPPAVEVRYRIRDRAPLHRAHPTIPAAIDVERPIWQHRGLVKRRAC